MFFVCFVNVLKANTLATRGYSGTGYSAGNSYINANQTEHINMQNGNLVLTYNDVYLPGKAGFDLNISRSYNSMNSHGFGVILLDIDHSSDDADDYKWTTAPPKRLGNFCNINYFYHDVSKTFSDANIGDAVGETMVEAIAQQIFKDALVAIGLNSIAGIATLGISQLISIYKMWYNSQKSTFDIASFTPKQWAASVNGVVGLVAFPGLDDTNIDTDTDDPDYDERLSSKKNHSDGMWMIYIIMDGGAVYKFMRKTTTADFYIYEPISNDVKYKLYYARSTTQRYILRSENNVTYYFKPNSGDVEIKGKWKSWAGIMYYQYYYCYYANLEKIKDRYGNQITISRDPNAHFRITQIVDSLNRVVNFNYSGNVTTISYPGSRSVKLTYDGNGNLISSKDAENRETTFKYDSKDVDGQTMFLLKEVNYPGGGKCVYKGGSRILNKILYPDKNNSSFYYETAFSYYGLNKTKGQFTETYVTDHKGTQNWYHYSLFENEKTIIGDTFKDVRYLLTQKIDAKAIHDITTDYTYNSVNYNLLKVKVSKGGQSFETEYGNYDSYGNVGYIEDPTEHKKYFSYKVIDETGSDPLGRYSIHNLKKAWEYNDDGDEIKLEYVYDYYQNITQIINGENDSVIFTYDSEGNLITSQDTKGHITTFIYPTISGIKYPFPIQINGNVTTPGGSIETISINKTYDYTTGNVLTEQDGEGNKTGFQYDKISRLKLVTYPDTTTLRYGYNDSENIVTLTDAENKSVQYYYDTIGRLRRVKRQSGLLLYQVEQWYNSTDQVNMSKDSSGNVTYNGYDRLKRLKYIKYPDETRMTFEYHDFPGSGLKLIKEVIDANGKKTTFKYDIKSQLKEVIEASHISEEQDKRKTKYEYDSLGNLKKIIDSRENWREFYYSKLNRLLKVEYKNGRIEKYGYDKNGNLIVITNARSEVIQFEYDELNRLRKVLYPDSSKNVEYRYNKNSIITNIDGQYCETHFKYNQNNQLIKIHRNIENTIYTMEYNYTANGNLNELTMPDGKKVGYEYDGINRLTRNFTGSKTLQKCFYDSGSRIKEIEYGNGVKNEYNYDINNQLTRIIVKNGSKILMDEKYNYDMVGNRIRTTKTRGAIESYRYDKCNRLSAVHYQISGAGGDLGSETKYQYDSMGNRTMMTTEYSREQYTYDDDTDELLETASGEKGKIEYSYDEAGNMILEEYKVDDEAIKKTEYKYDYGNNLVEIKQYQKGSKVTNVVNNYYDGGWRIKKEVGIKTKAGYKKIKETLYPFGNTVIEKTNGKIEKEIYFIGNVSVNKQAGTEKYHYMHSNPIGSICRITGEDGSLLEYNEYDPYGNIIERSTKINNRYLFSGKELDRETGLYYFGARYYNPRQSRWTSEDPIDSGGSLYAYCYNSPLNLVDLWGLQSDLVSVTEIGTEITDSTMKWYKIMPIDLPLIEPVKNIGMSAAAKVGSRMAFNLSLNLISQSALSSISIPNVRSRYGRIEYQQPKCFSAIGKAIKAAVKVACPGTGQFFDAWKGIDTLNDIHQGNYIKIGHSLIIDRIAKHTPILGAFSDLGEALDDLGVLSTLSSQGIIYTTFSADYITNSITGGWSKITTTNAYNWRGHKYQSTVTQEVIPRTNKKRSNWDKFISPLIFE